MKRIFNCFLSAATLCTMVLSWSTANAQDTTDFPIPAEDLMADVLNLNDPVTSIWPSVNDVEIESLSAAVSKLMEAYESDRLDADDRTRRIQSMIADAEGDEKRIKQMIKIAKDADDDVEKDRLEDLKDDYEVHRKYLSRISKVRDGERKLAETRIDYVSQLDNVLTIARQLVSARATGGTEDLLGTERELIRQSKELGARLGAVASNLKKVNGEREKAYKDREKLIAKYH